MPKHASSGQYAIVGLGVVAGPQQDHSERMVAAEAARRAIADAGLTPKDIDGAIDLRRTGGGGDRATYVDAYSRLLGLNNCFYFVVGRGGALAGLGIATALSFLDRGIANYVCIMGAVTDWSQAQESRKAGHRGMAHGEKAGYWGKALGDLRAVSHHSWMAARHMAVYGTTSRQLGAISVAQRAWACKNPEAKMHGRPITIEDHQNSPLLGRALSAARHQPGLRRRRRLHPHHRGSRQEPTQAAGLCAGPGLRRGLVGVVVGEEEFHPHGGAARQAAGLRPGRPRARRRRLRAVLRLLHRRGAVPARGLRLLQERRGRRLRGIGRHRARRQHSGQHQRRPPLLLSSGRSHRHGGSDPPAARRGRRAADRGLRRRHDHRARRRADLSRHVLDSHLHLAGEAS